MNDGNRWVALSISDPPRLDLVERGLSKKHLDLVFVEVSRHLLAARYHLAYGGDLRLRGYTDQLLDLVRSYYLRGEPAIERPAPRVRNYLAAPLYDASEPGVLAAARNVGDVVRVDAPDDSLPADLRADEAVQRTLALTAMRERITAETVARVLIAGATTGTAGRAPGVLEEAWLSVSQRKPLFVLGGYGGVAALVADVLLHRDTAAREGKIASDEGYRAMTAKLAGALPPGVPADGGTMLEDISRAGVQGMENGLTTEENARLFDSDDTDEVIALVLRGLRVVTGAAA